MGESTLAAETAVCTRPLPDRRVRAGSADNTRGGVPEMPGIPDAWLRLCRHEPRPLQMEGLAALATGRDVVARLATGYGKSLLAHVAATAAW